jgi:hypothetical protein
MIKLFMGILGISRIKEAWSCQIKHRVWKIFDRNPFAVKGHIMRPSRVLAKHGAKTPPRRAHSVPFYTSSTMNLSYFVTTHKQCNA